MNLEIHFRQMESTEALRASIHEKAEKLSPLLADDEHVTVIVGAKAHRHFAEIYFHERATGKDLVLKKEGSNLYAQIDELFEATYIKIHRVHQKRQDQRQKRVPLKKAASGSKK